MWIESWKFWIRMTGNGLLILIECIDLLIPVKRFRVKQNPPPWGLLAKVIRAKKMCSKAHCHSKMGPLKPGLSIVSNGF